MNNKIEQGLLFSSSRPLSLFYKLAVWNVKQRGIIQTTYNLPWCNRRKLYSTVSGVFKGLFSQIMLRISYKIHYPG